MIIRPLPPATITPESESPRPAAEVFTWLQKQAAPPHAIIYQFEHSQLAGQLAEALSPVVFGGLPQQVIQGIAQHDYGWQASDEAQMRSLHEIAPRPFPAMSTEETLPSWYASVAHARSLGELAYIVVSRHFTILAAGDESRAEFVRTETRLRKEIESGLSSRPEDLDRWTRAIGFCDLVSLYLCSGAQQAVQFPLAHLSDPASMNAPTTVLSWDEGAPKFSPPVFKPGTTAGLEARIYSGSAAELKPLHLEWFFPKG